MQAPETHSALPGRSYAARVLHELVRPRGAAEHAVQEERLRVRRPQPRVAAQGRLPVAVAVEDLRGDRADPLVGVQHRDERLQRRRRRASRPG